MDKIERILVVVNDRPRQATAITRAQELAERYEAAITVIDVQRDLDKFSAALSGVIPSDELRSLVLKHRQKQLLRMVRENDSAVCQTAEVRAIDGVPFIEIIREVLRHDHDFIIKVAEGEPGPQEQLFGSADMHLMRKSPVPVWILDPEQTVPPKRIVAAIDTVDATEESYQFNRRILGLARTITELSGAEFHLLSAWHLIGESDMLHSPFLKIDKERVQEILEKTESSAARRQEDLVAWLSRTYPNTTLPDVHCVKGLARDVIPAFIREHDVDLVVMGTVGRTGIPGLLIGNTAESVLNQVRCSVLTVKPQGFATPVVGGD